MDIIRGLFPLLFVAIYFFLLINLFMFGRKTANALPVLILAGLLLVSQFGEFLFCFFEIDSQVLLFISIAGVWIAPVFVVIFMLRITGLERLVKAFYLLAGVFTLTLIFNFGEFIGNCSLLSVNIEYPSRWLFTYLGFAFLIIAAVKLNFSFKNISDVLEIKKRRILLYCLILTLISTLTVLLLIGEQHAYMESIFAKTHIFILVGMAFFIIREKYSSQQSLNK